MAFVHRTQEVGGSNPPSSTKSLSVEPRPKSRFLWPASFRSHSARSSLRTIANSAGDLAKKVRDARHRHQELGLGEEEAAFYDALVGSAEATW
jgi:hypothetical protein